MTSSTRGQSERIGHVSQSMGELEDMTQQNAALAEQGSAAAESLRDQASRLTQLVAEFRLSRDEAPSSSPGRERGGHFTAAAQLDTHQQRTPARLAPVRSQAALPRS